MKKLLISFVVAIVGLISVGLVFIHTSLSVQPHLKTRTQPVQTTTKNDTTNQDNQNIQPIVPWEKTGNRIDLQPVHPGNVIYYKLTDNDNDPYAQLWQQAIAKWNSLGVIKFQQVANDYNHYCVVLGGNYNPTQGKQDYDAQQGDISIADTTFKTTYYPDSHVAYFSVCEANLTDMVSSMPKDEQLFAAEHELGHVLGFDHDGFKYDGMDAVMNWQIHDTDHTKPIGNYEKMALQAIYK